MQPPVKRRFIYITCFLFMLLFLTGCWDQASIDQRAYVVAIGLDKGEKENEIKITYLISNPELSKQEGGTSEPNKEIISFETNDLITARNMANAVIAKEISYSLLSVFIVSEELARENDFVRFLYDSSKEREIKRDMPIIVTKENASTFIMENNPKLETRIHKYFELILKYGSEAGLIPDTNLHSFFRVTEADADLFLAIYGTTEENDQKDISGKEDEYIAGDLKIEGETNKTQFIGSAVFKEGKMIGKLNGEETRIAVLLNDTVEMAEILTTYSDPFNEKYRISARLMKKENNEIKMNLRNGEPTIDVVVPIYMDILSNYEMTNYQEDSDKRKQLKKHIEQEIEEKIDALVHKTQEEFKGEPFGWSLIARKFFKTIPEYEKYNWMENYPKMKVNVTVDIVLGKFGRQSELPDLKQVRD